MLTPQKSMLLWTKEYATRNNKQLPAYFLSRFKFYLYSAILKYPSLTNDAKYEKIASKTKKNHFPTRWPKSQSIGPKSYSFLNSIF